MKAVHTFWFAPMHDVKNARALGGFTDERAFWMSWALAFVTAQRQFPEIALYTDSYGAEIIQKQLRFPYYSVSTELDELSDIPPGFWNVGKFISYLKQSESFIHLDLDVFLFEPIPRALLGQALFGQSFETAPTDRAFYASALSRMQSSGVKLPNSWINSANELTRIDALNCGIFGGSDISLIHRFATDCLEVIRAAENRSSWKSIATGVSASRALWHCSVAIEQLTIIFECRQRSITPATLLSDSALMNCDATSDSYSHLYGNAKLHPQVTTQIEQRLQKEARDYWQRVNDWFLERPKPKN